MRFSDAKVMLCSTDIRHKAGGLAVVRQECDRCANASLGARSSLAPRADFHVSVRELAEQQAQQLAVAGPSQAPRPSISPARKLSEAWSTSSRSVPSLAEDGILHSGTLARSTDRLGRVSICQPSIR